MIHRILILNFFLATALCTINAQDLALRIGVVGLSHGHVGWILNTKERKDITVVGFVETNQELVNKYAKEYNYPLSMFYTSINDMILHCKPEAVTAFGDIHSHLDVVQTCAPKGIHVMVEKPLAVNIDHAREMETLARKHGIHLLTNYETSWYPSNHKAIKLLKNGTVGDLRRVVIRDGHKGPKKIGVSKEFLSWLTDPVLNGGGAITDFGCYGTNLITWIMEGEKPNSVTAITQQLQSENNPKVDDEATIILAYDTATAVLEASWNWPIGRKDMEIYGLTGAIYADNRNDLRVRIAEGYDGYDETIYKLEDTGEAHEDPFAYLEAVIRNKIKMTAYDLYSLENNMIAMEILDAAIRSARLKKTIELK